jgi:hypothetical protein
VLPSSATAPLQLLIVVVLADPERDVELAAVVILPPEEDSTAVAPILANDSPQRAFLRDQPGLYKGLGGENLLEGGLASVASPDLSCPPSLRLVESCLESRPAASKAHGNERPVDLLGTLADLGPAASSLFAVKADELLARLARRQRKLRDD